MFTTCLTLPLLQYLTLISDNYSNSDSSNLLKICQSISNRCESTLLSDTRTSDTSDHFLHMFPKLSFLSI